VLGEEMSEVCRRIKGIDGKLYLKLSEVLTLIWCQMKPKVLLFNSGGDTMKKIGGSILVLSFHFSTVPFSRVDFPFAK
jgi:hypothetical protein